MKYEVIENCILRKKINGKWENVGELKKGQLLTEKEAYHYCNYGYVAITEEMPEPMEDVLRATERRKLCYGGKLYQE